MSKPIVPGPTYAEMRNPLLLPPAVREAANAARSDELNRINLFNINWKNTGAAPEALVLPKELTGVQANIVVLSGRNFPSGSMKVGPAYATLAESRDPPPPAPGRPHRHRPEHGQFRHRHGLCEPAQRLPGHRGHARQHEPGTLRAHPEIQRRAGPDPRHRVRCDPHPGAHPQRLREQTGAICHPGPVRAHAQLPLPSPRHRRTRWSRRCGAWAMGASRPSPARRAAPARWRLATMSNPSIQTPRSWRWNPGSAAPSTTAARASTASRASATRW